MRLPSFVASLAALGERRGPGGLESRQDANAQNKIGNVPNSPPEGLMFVLPQPLIAVARMDPILAHKPGDVASHVHDIFGASNFRSVLNTPEEQARATCTPTNVQDDKSNYWSPTLYFMHENGQFEPISAGARSYYFASPGNSNDFTTPFPRGMRVISGTAMTRYKTDIRRQFTHMDYFTPSGKHDSTGQYLPNGTNIPEAPRLVRSFAYFPSCGWANQSLDSDDHFSHLTWPIENGGGHGWFKPVANRCPPSHPIKYPTLMLETNHYLNDKMQKAWRVGQENLIFSNGDTVGTSYHADFVSGWDEGTLKEAINTCSVGDNVGACGAFVKSIANNGLSPCLHQGMQPDENVGMFEPITQLPGANCRWGPEGGDEKPSCPATPTPGWTYPNVMHISRAMTQSVLIPAKLPVDQTLTEEALAKYSPQLSGHLPYLRPCSEDGNESMEIIHNRKEIKCGTNQDIIDNTDINSARNKVDEVSGMQDSSQFTGISPPNIVGTGAWRVSYDLPQDSCWTADSAADDHNNLCLADTATVLASSFVVPGSGAPAEPKPAVSASSASSAQSSGSSSASASGSSSAADSSSSGSSSASASGSSGAPSASASAPGGAELNNLAVPGAPSASASGSAASDAASSGSSEAASSTGGSSGSASTPASSNGVTPPSSNNNAAAPNAKPKPKKCSTKRRRKARRAHQ